MERGREGKGWKKGAEPPLEWELSAGKGGR